MDEKPFDSPVTLQSDEGEPTPIATTQKAFDYLSEYWPATRGPRHRDALETCLKVLAGERSTVEAREALLGAAEEAGLSPRE